MKVHKLKINVKYFEAVKYGIKKFIVRKYDRKFRIGDILILQEWDGNSYTGREVTRIVSYIIDLEDYGLDESVKIGIE